MNGLVQKALILAIGVSLMAGGCNKNHPPRSSTNTVETARDRAQPVERRAPKVTQPGVHFRINGKDRTFELVSASVLKDDASNSNQLAISLREKRAVNPAGNESPEAWPPELADLVFNTESRQLVSFSYRANLPRLDGALTPTELSHDMSKPRKNGLDWAEGQIETWDKGQLTARTHCLFTLEFKVQRDLVDSVKSENRISIQLVDISLKDVMPPG